MALELVNRRDLSPAASLTPEEEHAIRSIAAGNAGSEAIALAVMEPARQNRLWLACDCRSEGGRRPLVAPCRNHRGTAYWRVLAGSRHIPHDPRCVFHREHVRPRDAARCNRPPRTAPDGYFAVLQDHAEERRVSQPSAPTKDRRDRPADRRPALSQLLLMLMERARLNRLRPVDDGGDATRWPKVMQECAAEIEIAPGRPLSDLWFPRVGMWRRQVVHARVREAARNWPAGHKPQGFLCWVVWDVEPHGIGTREGHDRVDVEHGVVRPIVGRHAVSKPYLFLGAVGLPEDRSGYVCLQAYAQPIVASNCPVPVDSDYERRVVGTLRTTLRILTRQFPGVEFELEKPVFEIETPHGPCLPDFLIRACRDGDEVTFVVEVMGFERPEYLQGKEVTHARMETLGTLCTMQASKLRSADGLTSEGRHVTETIRKELRRR